jgi:hypothetical protein
MGNSQRQTKDKEIEFLEKTVEGGYIFQVVDHAHRDRRISKATANTLRVFSYDVERLVMNELSSAAERGVMRRMWPRIDKAHRSGRRCLAIIDISDFPIVGCSVHEIDQQQVHPEQQGMDEFSNDDEFSKDLVTTWLGYDPASEVPAIVVNVNIHHKRLKVFRKDAFGL